MAELWNSGISSVQIGKKYGLNATTVLYHIGRTAHQPKILKTYRNGTKYKIKEKFIATEKIVHKPKKTTYAKKPTSKPKKTYNQYLAHSLKREPILDEYNRLLGWKTIA